MVGGGLFNMWWFILHALYVYLIDIFIKMNFRFKMNHSVGSLRTTVSVDLQNLMFCLAQNFKEQLVLLQTTN